MFNSSVENVETLKYGLIVSAHPYCARKFKSINWKFEFFAKCTIEFC